MGPFVERVTFWCLHYLGNNNNELYLHDQTNTYSIAKAIFRNQNYLLLFYHRSRCLRRLALHDFIFCLNKL